MPFLRQQSIRRYLLHTPGTIKDLPQSKNLVRGAATWTKTTRAVFQLQFHYFSAFCFKALGIHLSWKIKKWCCLIICTLFTSAFLVCWNDRTSLPVYWCFPKFPRLLAPLSTNVLFLLSMPSTFQIELHLHRQPFRILILVWQLLLLSM